MSEPLTEIVARLESLPDVDTVEAHPTDYDFCSPDIVHVSAQSDVEEEIRDTIKKALTDDERYLQLDLGGYMIYRPLGTVSEDGGSTFDMLGIADRSFEAVLSEPAPHETTSVGSVLRFDSDDTDIEVSIDRTALEE